MVLMMIPFDAVAAQTSCSLCLGSWVAGSFPATKMIRRALVPSSHFSSSAAARTTRATYSVPPLVVRAKSFP